MTRPGVTAYLRTFEDVTATFFEIESDFLIAIDQMGNLKRVNPSFRKLLGYEDRDVIGQGFMRLVNRDDWLVLLRTFASAEPAPFRLLKKFRGEVGVRIVNRRFKQHMTFLVLRPIGESLTDTDGFPLEASSRNNVRALNEGAE